MKTISYAVSGLLLLVFCISGCQDIFTYGPLDILQRDPSTLSKDQQLLYARQALSSGDDDAMSSAVDLVEDTLIPGDPNNADLFLLLGDLKWRLSHAPIALQNYLFNNSNQFPDPADYITFANDIQSGLSSAERNLLYDAANNCYYYAENTLTATLNAVQQLATGVGILAYQAQLPLGSQDLAMILAAETYITNAISVLVPVP